MNYDVEILYHPHPHAKGIILFWPCWLGDFKAKFYEISPQLFYKENYSLLLYNPPGHGKSAGVFDIETSIAALDNFLEKNKLKNINLYGISHSGGGSCLLKTAATLNIFEKLFLYSPVLNSRRSLYFMYEHNSINEFIQAFIGSEKDKNLHLEVFKDNRWLTKKYWDQMDYSNLLDYSITNRHGTKILSIAKLIENTMFPGINAFNELEQFRTITQVFLPVTDNWFPQNELIPELQQKSVPFTYLPQGSSHFLSGYWQENWKQVLKIINNH